MKASLNALNSKPGEQDSSYESKGETDWNKNENIKQIIQLYNDNTGMIFTNGDPVEVR